MLSLFTVGTLNAQLVTNGGFESSNAGIVDTAGWVPNGARPIKGWFLQVDTSVHSLPVFQIVSDTVEQGSRALKVTLHGVGANQWSIQIVADSIPVTPGATYNYSIWAKSNKPGATVNFTVGNYSYSEYKAIRPATLSTQWQNFTMQFTVTDTSRFIRGPIHFYGTVDTGNSIYVDNLWIADANAGKKPVIVEAESGVRGSNFPVLQDGGVTYVDVATGMINSGNPGDSSRMITYQVPFADSGTYDLFARVRVDSGGNNNGSFFYGNGFGVENDNTNSDWITVNGLAAAGFSDSSDVVEGPGALGTGVWKWVNLTKNAYQSTKGDSFVVSTDTLTKAFQIGGREEGLDIDKLAFGKSYLNFTVRNLDSVQAGSPDTGTVYKGPALAAGLSKFLGCSYLPGEEPDFLNYWDQVTPENAGKFGSVAISADTSQWSWGSLDAAYNLAINNHMPFKDHNLIWGGQQPAWISSGLDSAQQEAAIEQWIRMVGQRYPQMAMIDVVNEPIHTPPNGTNGNANYIQALGGAGATGWDWVIWAYQKARQYMPANTKLLINEYNILNSASSTATYLQIINLLKARNLIDGIGIQAHRFETESTDTNLIKSNLGQLAATGLPIYISEMDLGNLNDSGTPNDGTQLQLYQKIFPILWQYPGVKGITLWGYVQGLTWQTTVYLVRSDGTARPALLWLANYVKNNPLGVEQTASKLPTNFQLEQNYPNPFNPTTNIDFSLPKNGYITLKVYNILGQEVATLFQGFHKAGAYKVNFNASQLASGVYIYRLQSENVSISKKLVLVK
jgi:endo-1,4-beta-xylanase